MGTRKMFRRLAAAASQGGNTARHVLQTSSLIRPPKARKQVSTTKFSGHRGSCTQQPGISMSVFKAQWLAASKDGCSIAGKDEKMP